MKAANLGLRFVLELAMLAALAAWGIHMGGSTAVDVVLAVAVPAAAAVLWGLYAAPRSERRLHGTRLLAVQLVLLGLGAAALLAAGWPVLGVAFAIVIAVNALLLELSGSDASQCPDS